MCLCRSRGREICGTTDICIYLVTARYILSVTGLTEQQKEAWNVTSETIKQASF